MKKLLLFLLLAGQVNAQDLIITPYTICEYPFDEHETFILNSRNEEILQGLNPQEYSVGYFPSFFDAQNNINALPNLYTNTVPGVETIFVRRWENANPANYVIGLLDLRVEPGVATITGAEYTICDNGTNDGIGVFDLPSRNSEFMAGCANCSIEFYHNAEMAQLITNAAAFSNTINPQTVYAKVTSNSSAGCYAVSPLTLTVLPTPPSPNLPIMFACGSYNLTSNSSQYPEGVTLEYYTTLEDAEAGYPGSQIANPTTYLSNLEPVYVRAEILSNNINEAVCYSITEQLLDVPVNAASLVVAADSITVITNPPMDLQYSLNGSEWQLSNMFTNLPPGTYSVTVRDACGNIKAMTATIAPPIVPPTGSTSQTFVPGETLADLEVEGENIKWYANPANVTSSVNQTMDIEEPLLLTTLLVNNTTYYASQTVNGVESAQRLPVTVTATMGLNEELFADLSYHPNPVRDMLTIKNSDYIESVVLINLMGQTVLQQAPHAGHLELDTSGLQQGVYFVKMTSGPAEKTVKIIKE